MHDSYAALRVPDFRRLILARFLSTLGAQGVNVALGWQLYERTNSEFALGLVGLVEITPVLVFSLHAGHLSDTYNRKRICLVMRAVLAACSLALALLSWQQGSVALIYGCIFALGAARAFYGPASSALLPGIVPKELLENAVAWNSNSWQLAAALGPALGGLLIAASGGATLVYALDVGFSLAFILLVATVTVRQEVREREPVTLASLRAGYRFLFADRLLLSVVTLDLCAVLLGGATALLPVYARDILKVGPEGLGWMRAMPSAGAVLTALWLAHRPPFRRAGLWLLAAVAGFGAATIGFGLSRSFGVSLAFLFLLGAFDSVSVVIRSSLLLLRTPDAMRGRVSAVNSIFVGASNELGAFESGSVAAWRGPVFSVVSGGVGTLVVVLGLAFAFPELRRLREMRPPEDRPDTESAPAVVTSDPPPPHAGNAGPG